MPAPTRFVDDNIWLYDFADLFLVHCPRCDNCAKVVLKEPLNLNDPNETRKRTALNYAERRLVCGFCGFVDDWAGRTVNKSVTHDWFFARPLWLLMPCCNETLSAFNTRHIDFLESFVYAKLRQGARNNTHSLANTLPRWVQESRNRAEVVKCLEKLRKSIPEAVAEK